MKQRKLKQLLLEAASPASTWTRRKEICSLLQEQIFNTAPDGRTGLMRIMFDELYWGSIERRPEYAVLLLPVFLQLCGERQSDAIIGRVDWSKL